MMRYNLGVMRIVGKFLINENCLNPCANSYHVLEYDQGLIQIVRMNPIQNNGLDFYTKADWTFIAKSAMEDYGGNTICLC